MGIEKMGFEIPGEAPKMSLISMDTKLSISDQSKQVTNRQMTIINESLIKFTKLQAESGGKISAKDMEELVKDLHHVLHEYKSHGEGKLNARAFTHLNHEERMDAFKNKRVIAMEEHEGQTVIAMHEDLKTQVGECTQAVLHGAQGTPPRVVENLIVRAFTPDETKLMSTIQKTYEVYENTMKMKQQVHQSSEEGVTKTSDVQVTAPTVKGRTAQTSARAGEPIERRMEASTRRSDERMLENATNAADANKEAAKRKREDDQEAERQDIKKGIIKEGVRSDALKKSNIQRDEGIPPSSTERKR